MVAIVWIRRSMRKYDNKALVRASEEHDAVIPFYVVDDSYFDTETLGYPRVRFWRDSLEELSEIIADEGNKLVVRKGKPLKQLKEIIDETGAEEIYFNRDYTP